MAKNIGSAEQYAKPHTMSGGSVDVMKAVDGARDPNDVSARDIRPTDVAMRVSVSNPGADHINPYGVGKMRGFGAATKGTKISGKMG